MAGYVRPSDLRKHFKKLDTSGLTNADLKWYIVLAEAEIDGKLAVRYSIPFSATPPLVKNLATELSFLYVMDRFLMGEIAKSVVSRTDWREIRKKRVDKILDAIAKGECMLLDDSGNEIDPKADIGTIASTTGNYTPVFNMLDQSLQRIDEDRLDDELDAVDS